MRFIQRYKLPILVVLAGSVAASAYFFYGSRPIGQGSKSPEPVGSSEDSALLSGKIIVSEQAQQNLGLTSKPIRPQTFWKTIPVPGMVVDRPGRSDRTVIAPAAGVVTAVNYFPGDTVRPGEALVTLKLLSEPLHQAQSELFKATLDIALAQAERERLTTLKDTVAGVELIKVDNQIKRLRAAVQAYRKDLLTRGLSDKLIDRVAEGEFVNELTIAAPTPPATGLLTAVTLPRTAPHYEVQELKVELGQQVQAGQSLCLLANHRQLVVEGRAFRDETALLEQSVKEGWPVEVDFLEDPAAAWGEVKQQFLIQHLSNTIDPVKRTFAFWMPLENESRVVTDGGREQTLWRFRPGQKVRLRVRVAELDNVFVLPADAVAREGPEAFVFTQNVNTFTRKPVRVLYQDRKEVVLANDGSLPPGMYVVQGGAEQLNRMVKAGGSGGVPKGYHIHADGSLHKNEDEGK